MTVLAVAFGPLRGRSVRNPLFVDGVTANAADSLVLNAAGCENEAQPNEIDETTMDQGVSPHFKLILQEV